MDNTIEKYVTAYRKGLLTTDNTLFSEIQELVRLYNNIDSLYDDLVQLRNKRDEDGFYINDYDTENEYLAIIDSTEQLASSYRREIENLLKK